MAFSPDGKHAASSSRDTTVKLRDAATGGLQQTLKGHSDRVRALEFSLDSKLVASGSHEVRSIDLNVQGHTGLKPPAPALTAESVPMKLAALSLSALSSRTATHFTASSSAVDWSNDSFSEGEYESSSSGSYESWEGPHPDSVHLSPSRLQ